MTTCRVLFAGILATAVLSLVSACQTTPRPPASPESLQKGQQAFLSYCAMCHGDEGNGDGELASTLRQSGVVVARLSNPARMQKLGYAGVRRVIVLGGAHTGRSNIMPAWGERLPEDLISDIAAYVTTLSDKTPAIPEATVQKYLAAPAGVPDEGRRVFVHYCAACHGPFGRGDGTYAEALRQQHNIRPRDLTDSTYLAPKTDEQLFATISLGGAHVGKSNFMPAWSVSLSPEQIKSLASYIREISHTAPRP